MSVSRLFVLIGDPFLCEEKRKEILLSLKKKFGPNLALTLRQAGDTPVESLLSEARTLPFLAPAQVFCLREAERFSKKDLEPWDSYFKSPHPHSFFIFEASSLERGHPFLQWARSGGEIFSLGAESGKLVRHFIREKLRQAQKQMTGEALELLESRCGDSLVFLDSVIDQLIVCAGEKREIDRAAVEAFEEKLIHFEGYDLMEALAERKLPKALEILGDLLTLSSQDPVSLMGLLHWQIRRFWEAKKGLAEGVPEREISSRLRLFGARGSLFFQHLQRFSLKELEGILEGLFDLDWRLKTGRAEGRYEVETWLVNAIG